MGSGVECRTHIAKLRLWMESSPWPGAPGHVARTHGGQSTSQGVLEASFWLSKSPVTGRKV